MPRRPTHTSSETELVYYPGHTNYVRSGVSSEEASHHVWEKNEAILQDISKNPGNKDLRSVSVRGFPGMSLKLGPRRMKYLPWVTIPSIGVFR